MIFFHSNDRSSFIDGSINNIKVTFKDDIEFVKSKLLEIKK